MGSGSDECFGANALDSDAKALPGAASTQSEVAVLSPDGRPGGYQPMKSGHPEQCASQIW